MSNKCKLGLISRSFIVLSFVAVLSGGLAKAQNPYDSAMANSQTDGNGIAPSAAASPQGNGMPAPFAVPYGGTAAPQTALPADGVNAPVSAYGSGAVGQNAGEVYATPVSYEEQPTYGAGFSTLPDYPRNEGFNAPAVSTPDPEPSYPKSRADMAPERIHRNPPLTPYDQQETYSYITETTTSSSTCCQRCNEGYGNPYLWQVGAAAKVKHRAKFDKSDPAFFTGNGYSVIDSNTSFPVSAGAEIFLTRYLGRNAFNFDIWSELKFDGLYEWENTKTYYPQDNFYSNFGVGGLTTYTWEESKTAEDGTTSTTKYTSTPSMLHMDYSATMNSGEIMFQFRKRGRPDPLVGHPNGTWTRECQGGIRYTHMVGVNYTSYNEELTWTGTGEVYDSKKNFIGTQSGRAAIEADNNLLGLVFGGEMVDKHCIWSWGMRWRFTPYLNFMETQMNSTDGSANYLAKCSETDISYEAKWGIFTTLKTGKHMVWRLGYDLSCLGNIALANQNMDIGETIHNNNYNILQEFTLGCTLVW